MCNDCNAACATCTGQEINSCQSCNNGFLLQRTLTGTNHSCGDNCA